MRSQERPPLGRRCLESTDGEPSAALTWLPSLGPPPPRIPPSPRNENHFLSGFLRRQRPRRPEVISGMCVNTEFNGMLFAPLSRGGLRRG